MVKADKSKRSFFKKVATAAGFVSASGYLSKLISSHSNSIQAINENSERDVSRNRRGCKKNGCPCLTTRRIECLMNFWICITNLRHNFYNSALASGGVDVG